MLEYSKETEMAENTKIDMTIYNMQAEISKTLANPIRLAILHTLKEGEKSVNELTDLLGISQSNISQHLAIMRQKSIVTTRKQGTNIFYKVTDPKINLACDTMREVLLNQLKHRQELAKKYPT